MFRHPSGDALAHGQLEAVDHFRVWILGRTQDQFVVLDDVDEAGITFHQAHGKIQDFTQNFVKGSPAAAIWLPSSCKKSTSSSSVLIMLSLGMTSIFRRYRPVSARVKSHFLMEYIKRFHRKLCKKCE